MANVTYSQEPSAPATARIGSYHATLAEAEEAAAAYRGASTVEIHSNPNGWYLVEPRAEGVDLLGASRSGNLRADLTQTFGGIGPSERA